MCSSPGSHRQECLFVARSSGTRYSLRVSAAVRVFADRLQYLNSLPMNSAFEKLPPYFKLF